MRKAINELRLPAPLYFKMEKIGGEWVTKQIKYLTRSDAAALLNVSERTVYDYFNRRVNPLPHFEVRGVKARLFAWNEFKKWAESNRGIECSHEDDV